MMANEGASGYTRTEIDALTINGGRCGDLQEAKHYDDSSEKLTRHEQKEIYAPWAL